ncbi:Uncharacterised protein (plasmid) [Tsukamurella tyrosinosolvens]|uniref:Uncharacterized protein n=1 Tax=Tsukamurella tyrosinosolvens TaxID=57704 RepID=A0A1H4UIL9_TSUTY|nr:hypothetical protein [Tsukamurella tyrosinosolvens]SEC68722.1 hypothetical protein SAMN04489793_2921 [Tsukamurella tyrosinosolvens]VEH94264.1 Uncharacterised protein [Tsukamurella tyrosinosolvens]
MSTVGNTLVIIGFIVVFGGIAGVFADGKARWPAAVIVVGALLLFAAAGFQLAGNLGA